MTPYNITGLIYLIFNMRLLNMFLVLSTKFDFWGMNVEEGAVIDGLLCCYYLFSASIILLASSNKFILYDEKICFFVFLTMLY